MGLAPTWSEASRSNRRFGGPHTRWCTHKAVHTQRGLWPSRESCYLSKWGAGAGPRIKQSGLKGVWGGEVRGGYGW